jgi:thioredoxin 1
MKILYFSTRTCAPCAQFKPIVSSVCSLMGIQLEVMDAIERQDLASQYNIVSVPTLIIMDGSGNVVSRQTGAIPKAQLQALLSNYTQN